MTAFMTRNGHAAIRKEVVVPPKARTIVVAFDSLEQAQAAFASTAYRDARKIGDKYAKFRIWAIGGLAK